MNDVELIHGDCLETMRTWPDNFVDMVFSSPPYEDSRTYSIDFSLTGQEWVDWMVEVTKESLRVCRGLVAFVIEGKTRGFRWSATPALLMADLHRAGVHLRKPPIYQRNGIPGSGGPDWLRNDFEWIICATNGGRLPWADNTAMGAPPKFGPGGEMSHRLSDGTRCNQWGGTTGSNERGKDGKRKKSFRPSHRMASKTTTNGEMEIQNYSPPTLANPGNIINCGAVGGGNMGSSLASENEAPFPEKLCEFFVRSFCPEGGTVADLFCGSGTTLAIAQKHGRRSIGIDIRESQIELSKARTAQKMLF